jgi:hypothetical protein
MGFWKKVAEQRAQKDRLASQYPRSITIFIGIASLSEIAIFFEQPVQNISQQASQLPLSA